MSRWILKHDGLTEEQRKNLGSDFKTSPMKTVTGRFYPAPNPQNVAHTVKPTDILAGIDFVAIEQKTLAAEAASVAHYAANHAQHLAAKATRLARSYGIGKQGLKHLAAQYLREIPLSHEASSLMELAVDDAIKATKIQVIAEAALNAVNEGVSPNDLMDRYERALRDIVQLTSLG